MKFEENCQLLLLSSYRGRLHHLGNEKDYDTSWNYSFEFRHVSFVNIFQLQLSYPRLLHLILSYASHYSFTQRAYYRQCLHSFSLPFLTWIIQLKIKPIQTSLIGFCRWKMPAPHWSIRYDSIERNLNDT